jgi:hypothetical protein
MLPILSVFAIIIYIIFFGHSHIVIQYRKDGYKDIFVTYSTKGMYNYITQLVHHNYLANGWFVKRTEFFNKMGRVYKTE